MTLLILTAIAAALTAFLWMVVAGAKSAEADMTTQQSMEG